MNCPACRQPLVVVEHEGIEVDWCVACRGIWFDAGEVELLAEKAGRRFVVPALDAAGAGSAASGSPRRCPRCPAKMRPQAIPCDPPIQVDLCPRGHGIWLDRGELGALIRVLPERSCAGSAHPEASGGEPAQPEPPRGEMARPAVSFLGEVFQASLNRPPADGDGSPDPRRATPPGGSA